MRTWLLLASCALLAGCGGNDEDFTVDVAMAPAQAQAELAKLDGGTTLRALSLAAITASQADDALTFALPGDEDPGELLLRFEDLGSNMTRIHVALALPAQTATIDGERMVLSEGKAEDMLEARMNEWAADVGTSGYASLDELNQIVGGLSISLQPDTLVAVLAAGDDPDKLARLLDPEVMAEMMGGSPEQDYAEAAPLDEPMMNPASATANAAAPMDAAQGTAPKGVSAAPIGAPADPGFYD